MGEQVSDVKQSFGAFKSLRMGQNMMLTRPSSNLVPPSGEPAILPEIPIDPSDKKDGTRPTSAEGSSQEESNGDSM
jgi:hypothetical protein